MKHELPEVGDAAGVADAIDEMRIGGSIEQLSIQLYVLLMRAEDTVTAKSTSSGDRADIVFQLRELSSVLGGIIKRAESVSKKYQTVACAAWFTQNRNRPGHSQPVRGRYATGTPKTRTEAALPHRERDTERFLQLCQFLGLPEGPMLDGVAGFHWPNLQDIIDTKIKEGKPLPDGILPSETRTHFTLPVREVSSSAEEVRRKRKGNDEDRMQID